MEKGTPVFTIILLTESVMFELNNSRSVLLDGKNLKIQK